MIAAALLSSSSSSSSSLKSSSTMTTTTTTLKTTEQQVRTLIPVTTSDGSKVFVSGPCIVLKTQTLAPTVAQQMQALRPLLKATSITNTAEQEGKKPNDRNKKNTSDNTNNSTTSTLPKKGSGSNSENEPEPLRCKRRIDFTSLGLPRPQPAAMERRNERERNRVKQVNLGFETLRQHMPQGRKNKKLSKVDILKEAVKYIKYLHQLLREADEDADTTTITDTITMVSRSSPTTTSTPETLTLSLASSAVTASTNTTSITSSDLMQMTTSAVETSTTIDFSCESANDLPLESTDFSVFRLDNSPPSCSPDDLQHLAQLPNVQDFTNVRQHHANNVEVGDTSPCHLLELAPAQLSFAHNQSNSPSSAMNIDHLGVSLDPNADLPTTFNSLAPSIVSFINFNTSTTSSPDGSPLDIPPTQLRSEMQSFKMDQGGRGSDGSCPVSPSQSSGASESPGEECLGVAECETWQDLSADIAEWLCSKIDIDDPDVFV